MEQVQDMSSENKSNLINLSGFEHKKTCKICMAKHPISRIPIRADIEDIYKRMGMKNVLAYCMSMDIKVSAITFNKHLKNHAPYLRELELSRKVKRIITSSLEEHADADDALQTIINIGNKMVETGDMPVSEKMYLEALKLKQKHKAPVQITEFLKNVEGSMFGELVEDETPLLEEPEEQEPKEEQQELQESPPLPVEKEPEGEPFSLLLQP